MDNACINLFVLMVSNKKSLVLRTIFILSTK